MESKICLTCEQNKELSEYYTKIREDGSVYYRRECKVCVNIRSQKWRAKNPVRAKEIDQKYFETPRMVQYFIDKSIRQRESGYALGWQRANPEKAKIYNKRHRQHDITEAEWRNCLNTFGNTCAYCGLPIEQHIAKRNGKYFIMNFHKEHVDDDGYNDLRNAVPSCQRCNSSKHTSSIDDWYFKQEFFSINRYIKIIWWINKGYKQYIDDKPPYRIVKKKNENDSKFHHELWTVDKYRNMIEYVDRRKTKKEIEQAIENGIIKVPNIIEVDNFNLN